MQEVTQPNCMQATKQQVLASEFASAYAFSQPNIISCWPGWYEVGNQTHPSCIHTAWLQAAWLLDASQARWRRQPNTPLMPLSAHHSPFETGMFLVNLVNT